ncbi:MAG: class I SAM-dependent methyltransferase [Thermodesulfobacteriota bacterium]
MNNTAHGLGTSSGRNHGANTARDPYRHFAWLYGRVLDPWLRSLHRAVLERCRREGAKRVIDLCCGTGAQCRRLHRAGLDVTGVDISAAMVAQARLKSPADLPIVHGDAAHTPFGSGQFDAAVIQLALHEKPAAAREALLAEAARLVRAQGIVCICDFLGRPPASSRSTHWARSFVERLAGREHFACYQEYLNQGALPGVLAGLGWSARLEARFHRGATGLSVVRIQAMDF